MKAKKEKKRKERVKKQQVVHIKGRGKYFFH